MNVLWVGISKIGCVSTVSGIDLHLFYNLLNRERYKCMMRAPLPLTMKDLCHHSLESWRYIPSLFENHEKPKYAWQLST